MIGRRFTLGLTALVLIAATAWAAGRVMSVQVRQGQLRQKPHFLSRIVATLPYAARVSVEAKDGPWYEVTTPDGRRGWIHLSALSKKRIVLKSGREDVAVEASGEELALAGKGFNKQVEDEFRAGRAGYNYAWVNRAEKNFGVSPADAAAFVEAGGLKPMAKVVYTEKKTRPAEAEERGESDAP